MGERTEKYFRLGSGEAGAGGNGKVDKVRHKYTKRNNILNFTSQFYKPVQQL